MIRTAVRLIWSAWGGHAALIAGSLLALQIHAAYRVPAAVFVTVLPWLGVVVTVTTILMLTVNLLPRARARRAVHGLTARRIGWLATLVVATTAAATLAGMRSLAAALLGLALGAAAAAVIVITGRLLAEGSVVIAVRWLYRAMLFGLAVFLLWTAIVLVNGALDRAAATEQPSEVLSVVTAPIDPGVGGLIPHAHVDLRSWGPGDGVERLVLSPRERPRTWVGQPVTVTVRPGFLGIPWVASVTLDEARHLRQVLAASPRAMHAMQRLITIQLERQQWDEAMELTRRYADTYPDDVAVVAQVAGVLGEAGRYQDQGELIERLVVRSQRPDGGR
jgi:tetratricopeptide repeat protein